MNLDRLEIEGLKIGYTAVSPLAQSLDATASPGELVAIVGRNGVGKSTLLRTLAGVQPPLNGQVRLGQRQIYGLKTAERARAVALVTTEHVAVAHLRAAEVVALGRAPYTGFLGRLSAEDQSRVAQAMTQVGVDHLSQQPIDRLSDGERQRVMIARALAQDTPVLLLDEPTAFLDLPNRYQIALLLRELAHDLNKIVLFSSHDLSIAMQLADKLWVMTIPAEREGAAETTGVAGISGISGLSGLSRVSGITGLADAAENQGSASLLVGTPAQLRANGSLETILSGIPSHLF